MAQMTNLELLEKFRTVESPIDRTLGLEFVEVDREAGTCVLKFEIGREFTGPLGAVFGGIQSAMLDSALSIAGTAKSGNTMGMVSLEIKTTYLRTAATGTFTAKGRALKVGKKVAFLESDLFDADENLVAKACGSALPVPMPNETS